VSASEPSESSTHPKALFPYLVLRVSIPVLNMYLSQTYSSDDCEDCDDCDDCDEDESLKAITNCIMRYIMRCIMRLYGREEVFNMSLVSVKMVENQAAPVSSTIRTRKNQS
jgi:hypothetical protein